MSTAEKKGSSSVARRNLTSDDVLAAFKALVNVLFPRYDMYPNLSMNACKFDKLHFNLLLAELRQTYLYMAGLGVAHDSCTWLDALGYLRAHTSNGHVVELTNLVSHIDDVLRLVSASPQATPFPLGHG